MTATKTTKHGVIIVDDCDADLLPSSSYIHGKGRYYARTYLGQKPSGAAHQVLTHRIIVSRMLERPLTSNEYVDHRDGNGLNNQRDNLRLCTLSQNQGNQSLSKRNKSGYKGVFWDKNAQKWVAKMRRKYLGCFTDPADAHAAYMDAARAYFGEFANSGTKEQP